MAVILPSVYKDGTATVAANGTAVTGQNTLWVNSILPGDFWGVHKGLPIRIATVNSNTSITLANPWPGAAQTAAAYEIMLQSDNARMQETSRQLLAALSSGNAYSLSTLASAADTLPYFTGAGTMSTTAFNAAARALLAGGVLPNAQLPPRIRANTAVVTNLNTVFENGIVGAGPSVTGAPYSSYWLVKTSAWSETTQAIQRADELFGAQGSFIRIWSGGVWGVWRPSASVVVGTVAQSGGLATGAIIERGSNSNGQYTRFADGTQICFGSADLGYFNSSDLTTTKSFPASFSSNPGLSITATFDWPSGTPRSVPMYVRQNGITPSYFLGSATNPSNNNQSGDIFRVAYTAIGRWF